MTRRGLRILVAEDEALIRMLIVDTLDEAGYDVLEASGGEQALKLLVSPDDVDILVTDLHMPGADGIAVATAARRHHPEIPVLFVTARGDLLENPGTPTPYDLLTKPFSLVALGAAVDEIASRRA